jgi:hypothetical protein
LHLLAAPVLGYALGATYVIAAVVAGAGLLTLGVALVIARRERPAPGPKRTIRIEDAGAPMVCPSCQREFPPGTSYCPSDARKLVAAGAETRSSLHCPRCRRAFDGGTRFCPFDAEELVPQSQWTGHDHHDHDGDGTVGKICPVCAAKYGLEAVFCGRDGSELMTVN